MVVSTTAGKLYRGELPADRGELEQLSRGAASGSPVNDKPGCLTRNRDPLTTSSRATSRGHYEGSESYAAEGANADAVCLDEVGLEATVEKQAPTPTGSGLRGRPVGNSNKCLCAGVERS